MTVSITRKDRSQMTMTSFGVGRNEWVGDDSVYTHIRTSKLLQKPLNNELGNGSGERLTDDLLQLADHLFGSEDNAMFRKVPQLCVDQLLLHDFASVHQLNLYCFKNRGFSCVR